MVLTRWVFLRLLGVVYLAAFVSLGAQVRGLIGDEGILPVGEYLDAVQQQIGIKAYWRLPTLLWLDHGDGALVGMCWAGAAASLLLIAGIAPAACLIVLLALYQSLVLGGQTFLGYQWDTLLLETGVPAILIAPWKLRDRVADAPPPPVAAVWLLWWLLFRLMFSSGIVKLTSGDPLWRELTAVAIHYESQPLPTWIGWLAFQMPLWFQKISCFAMFFVELVAPFFIFGPRRVRLVAFMLLVGLQGLIALTGNYAFFNLLSVALCVLLLDDAALRRCVPRRWRARTNRKAEAPKIAGRVQRVVALVAALILFPAGTAMLIGLRTRSAPILPFYEPVQLAVYDARWVNGYGLFANMTEGRREIAIEGSNDGREWEEWPWKWKPDDPERRPRFVAPHQPRLDWQMWFAALGHRNSRIVVQRLMVRLLEGSEPVEDLLGPSPFPDGPPRYLRAAIYDYHMTDWKTLREEGTWWRRERLGVIASPVSLSQNSP
jgi:hypothetical protein